MNSENEKFDERLELLERSVRAHHPFLVRYANRILRNWADAEDAVSELWRYAIVHLDKEHINCLPILRKKVYFLSIDCIRKRKGREVLLEDFDRMPMQAPPANAFTEEEEAAFAENFWREIGPVPLTEEQKLATWSSIRFSYTIDNIAARMNTSRSTVGDWVAKGKEAIRNAMR